MKKLLIGTALLVTALPFTFDGVTPTVSKAHAVLGRPLTPMSVAGVHRRAMRRTYGVGANLGYHPVARAALYGAAATGAGYYGAGYGVGAATALARLMAMAPVIATRLTATAMAGALFAAVSMPPLGVIGAKTPD